jgi:serine protease AprX
LPRAARGVVVTTALVGLVQVSVAMGDDDAAASGSAAGDAAPPTDPVEPIGGAWKPDVDNGSFYLVNKGINSNSMWSRSDSAGNKYTGRGIGVALIDSGVVPVEGLSLPGKVIHGPDLSFESQDPTLAHLDTYGHGTHIAGIIAGKDSDVPAGNENDSTRFVGVAPDAHLVSLKVAASDGATDVSQVIAAIDWVVQHRNDPGLAIRVLNLSFGTTSLQPHDLDPLAHAVQNAWHKGIVVVVAAGNDGAASGVLTIRPSIRT